MKQTIQGHDAGHGVNAPLGISVPRPVTQRFAGDVAGLHWVIECYYILPQLKRLAPPTGKEDYPACSS